MSKYFAKVSWNLNGGDFVGQKYSREHQWEFDDGLVVPASASPHVVPLPMSIEKAVDPEEAFVASLSSCHMLWFISIAAGKKFMLQSYFDHAEGVMEKDGEGKLAVTKVTLTPHTQFTGEKIPDREQLDKMHSLAHKNCFIANSVKTEIIINLG